MKTHFLVALFAAISCIAAPKLSSAGARNAASYASSASANGGVAQGARFVLLGKDIGPADAVSNEAYPLATTLGGVSVKVTVGDWSTDAWVLSASATKVVAMLPSASPVGTGKVALTFNGETSETSIQVVARAVGVFTGGARGAGQAIAYSVDSGAALAANASARPGQQIRLRATGLGPVDGDEANGPTTKTFDTADLEVRITDKVANIISAQRIEVAGLDEIVIEVPADVDGCFSPLVIKNGDKYSNFVTVPVAANGGFCKSNLFSSGALENAAAAGDEIRIGSINLTRTGINITQAESVSDSADGSFYKYKIADYGNAGGALNFDFAFGGCMVIPTDVAPEEAPEVPVTLPVDLAAGLLNVTGPKGAKSLGNVKGAFSVQLGSGVNIALPPGVPSIPGLPSNLYLEPGAYTVAGAGGADVGAFSVQAQLNPVEWSNPTVAAAILRSQALQLKWTGGAPNDFVMAMGLSSDKAGNGASFICIAKASAGQITVPAYVLQNLPVSTSEASILGLFSVSEPKTFTASGLDLGALSFSRLFARQASYR